MRRNQSVTIAALIIAIVGLSIGFAAFSNTLTIRSSATVTPDESNFQVKFSKVSNADQTGSSYPITPIIPQGSDATGDNGIISESNPLTLTGLKANFTSPGEYVSYKLYVRNTGHYTAYLTNLDFKDIIGGEDFIECSGNDVSTNLRRAACDDISVSVTIGGTDGVNGDTYTSRDQTLTNEISQVSLAPGASTEVYVRISYADNGHYVDGNMTVNFGYIMLQYRSVDSPLAIPAPVDDDSCVVTNVKSFGNTCTLSEDNDSSDSVTKGDKVTCGTESFYVIENPSNETVKMLTEWNLNVSEPGNMEGAPIEIPYSYTYCESTVGYQDSHVRGYLEDQNSENLFTLTVEYQGQTMSRPWPYGTVKFDRVTTGDYGYWTTGDNHQLDTSKYVGCSGECNYSSSSSVGGYPAYVYDNNATLKTFVDTYVGYLNSAISGANATGRLINTTELEALGCSLNNYTCENSTYNWIYGANATSFWSGFANVGDSVWSVRSSGYFGSDHFGEGTNYGVRPVITISSSAIQTS